MKRRWVPWVVVVLLATTSIISTTVVLAGAEDGESSGFDKLSSKVAAILGLDQLAVDDAIKQARRELWDEALQYKLTAYRTKLTAMVELGKLTREQADEKMASIQVKRGDEGLQYKLTAYRTKLTAMVKLDKLTQEQADAKMASIQAKWEPRTS